jgi:hypothetical protein
MDIIQRWVDMGPIRDFSASQNANAPLRNIDADAPAGMRQEIVDLVFFISENTSALQWPSPRQVYQVSCQSIGVQASGNPAAGFRQALGRDIANVEWRRVYDLICRLWPEFETQGLSQQYREGINRILAGYGIVWELHPDGHLRRFLPIDAQAQIAAAIGELRQARFQAAARLFSDARDAYDARPRRDNDACTNAFKAMESVAKIVFGMPNDTFGNVLGRARANSALKNEFITVLEAINALRNRKLGHGMPTPFDLSPSEVDFTYLSCVAGILLFARLSPP